MNKDDLKNLLEGYKDKKLSKEDVIKQLGKNAVLVNKTNAAAENDDIAVIGMSCRFPFAENIEEYWNVIRNGINTITKVPKDRFDIDSMADTDCKWGGFLKDIDKFDSLFFNISPKEAEMMDPQQRLFLMEAWNAIEDAGYSAQDMNEMKCSVFVGHADGDYKIRLKEDNVRQDAYYFMGNSGAILSARISYLLNLRGPSLSLDTACSSSLVALHLACESMRSGESEMTIVGGVSVFLTPQLYLLAGNAGMLSADGQCKAFDNSANGFVPAEGVGVIILKPLSRALKDKDRVYAVIKGSGINQDGRSNGITAPCAVSQTSLEQEVYDKYGIDPKTISYIEAHGTGTILGDPIEVVALTDAFKKFTSMENYCALGSVKANIGHAQLAAGVASVIKAVLMLQHKEIPPLVNFNELNGHINLENTPFYINTELKEWEAQEDKRQVAVSGFGFSGTNAHVVLEEYDQPVKQYEESNRSFYPICISAKTKAALINELKELRNWINRNRWELTTERISYSLLKYKSHYNIRTAFVVSDIKELLDKLEEFKENTDRIEITDVKARYKANNQEAKDIQRKIQRTIDELASDNCDGEKENSGYLAEAYKAGFLFEADELYIGKEYRRMSMPKYQYDLEKFWYHPEKNNLSCGVKSIDTMISQNISTIWKQEYETVLKQEFFYIKDHDVNGSKVLPGVAYLELARQAGKAASNKKAVVFEQIVWQKPIEVEEAEYKVYTQLTPLKDGLKFNIYSNKNELHCQGSMRFDNNNANRNIITSINVNDIKEKLLEEIDRNEHYEYFTSRGMHHGERLKGVQKLYSGKSEALAYIELPKSIANTKNDFELHPTLLDSALQSVIGVKEAVVDDNNVTFLPFSIRKLSIYSRLQDSIYAYARQTGKQEFTVRISDKNGSLIADVEGLVMRKLSGEVKGHYTYLEPVWKKEDIPTAKQTVHNAFIMDAVTGNMGMWSADKDETDNLEVISTEIQNKCKEYIYVVGKANDKANLLQKGVYGFFQFVKGLISPGKMKGLNILYAYDRDQADVEVLDAVTSFCKAFLLENPSINLSSVGYDRPLTTKQLVMELSSRQNEFVRYENGSRYGEVFFKARGIKDSRGNSIGPDTTYLITGGNGKIGGQIADYLVNERSSKVVIIGRNDSLVSDILSKSEKVSYYQADLCDENKLARVIETIIREHGPIEGVFHCAGIHKDSFIWKKTIEEFQKVIAPKVTGTDNLIRCLKNHFKYFVSFSSTTSICGTPGQSDYAYANGYLNECSSKYNSGETRYISICWPYWENGGMQVSDEDKAFMHDTMGLEAITASEGIKALETIISSGKNNVIFIKGDENKFYEYLNKTNALQNQININMVRPNNKGDVELNNQLYQKTQKAVYDQISSLIKIDRDKLDDSHDFTDYGFDSILLTSLTNNINKLLGTDFMPTVFFDANRIGEFIQYLCKEYHDLLMEKFRLTIKENIKEEITGEIGRMTGSEDDESHKELNGELSFESTRFLDLRTEEAEILPKEEAIAIIGMSGKMPQCDNLEEFFRKLEAETDFITEIPKERWDWRESGKEDMRWGAFMKEIDTFDAFFFSVSPREAELMDPQQRILLECVWHTIEDAGYKASELQGSNTGVFIGASTMDYTDLSKRMNVPVSGYTSTGRAHSILANRISYIYDFHGPSEPIDTACSSSLIAIIRGINAIKNGDCDMVIAGGVNVIASDDLYVAFSKSGMLARDGKCKTFDKEADGYARGEGVGTVLLKPLSKAEADGDQIYAVIRGGTVNHGGHANSLTAPSAGAQASLIVKAYETAKVNPLEVSYIETHGTGTKLGDPIEIEGLNKAFKQMYRDYGISEAKEEYCGIGSVKSNIGHLEAAAGIASVFKVILSMKNRKIPASINIKELNPYLKIKKSPFHIVQKTMDWTCDKEKKRIAGISCYGYGGANAHLILEEYNQKTRFIREDNKTDIFVYSAKNKERLSEYIKNHITFLESKEEDNTFSLASYAYVLLTGREEMEERLAITAENTESLLEALNSYIKGEAMSNCYADNIESGKEFLKALRAGDSWDHYLETVTGKKDYKTLAALWVKGLKVDWKTLYHRGYPEKISIPLYPFKEETYWLPGEITVSNSKPELHPLVDENISTVDKVLFKKTLSQNDFFIKDHNIQGVTILPGVAYLEMARAAGELATGKAVGAISDVIWAQAIEVGKTGKDSFIQFTKGTNNLSYNIYYTSLGKDITASQGKILTRDKLDMDSGKTFDVSSIEKRSSNVMEREEAYSLFKTLGFRYGESFKSIQRIKSNETEAIGAYKLPELEEVKNHAFKLLIPVMDAALQTIMGTGSSDREGEVKQFIPFALKRLMVYDKIPENGYTYIRLHSQNEDGSVRKFDISILDENGKEVVCFEEFTSRAVKGLLGGFQEEMRNDKIYYINQWNAAKLILPTKKISETELFIVLGNEATVSMVKKELAKTDILKCIGVQRGYEYQKSDSSNIVLRVDTYEDYERLFADLNLNAYSEVTILHTFSAEENSPYAEPLEALVSKERLARGFYSMSYTVKALLSYEVTIPVKIAYLYHKTEEAIRPEYEMVNGMIKSVSSLSSRIILTTIAVDSSLTDNVMLLNLVNEITASSAYESKQIWYKKEERYEKQITGKNINTESELKEIREGDRVIITGGLGRLGKLFAEYLVKKNINVVLMGRRDADKDSKWLEELNKGKANIYYVKGDLFRYVEAEKMFEEAREHLGAIDGIIHAAGLSGEGTILDGDWTEYMEPLKPKVYGTINLDNLIRKEPIRYIICFSSVASQMGDFGACCYACGNEFLNAYAQSRNILADKQICNGKTYAIDWGIWAEGGMKLPADSTEQYYNITGMMPLSNKDGLDMFQDIMGQNEKVVIAVTGDKVKTDRILLKEYIQEATGTEQKQLPVREAKLAFKRVVKKVKKTVQGVDILEKATEYFRKVIADAVKIAPSLVEAKTSFEKLGINSFMVMEIHDVLDENFEGLSRTLFFEYQNLKDLVDYFISEHKDALERMFQSEVSEEYEEVEEVVEEAVEEESEEQTREAVEVASYAVGSKENYDKDIAIIGISGRYPMAESIEEFYENLKNGKDCIEEIPIERFDYRKFYDGKGGKGKITCKWGGFLPDVDKFDEEFFGIIPKVASMMDPQERLMLETAWQAIEDSGYTPKELTNCDTNSRANDVGVFIGMMYDDYKLIETQELINHNYDSLTEYWNSPIANRISFIFDFRGPSIAVDSACSSSLTTLHMACESIKNGDCKYAIAGGVSLSLHPSKYLRLADFGMSSPTGSCKSFGENADGYVPGEGVGAVLLKSLKQAEKDGDNIYAVIKGSSINHGGRANGFTVPNPSAQSDVVIHAMEAGKIDPRTISYIETHGTGTSLGDPIEITGLTKAFKKSTKDKQFCKIGSVKSNIGHCEGAAGISQVTKVALQLKNKQLFPSLHADVENPLIDFKNSPFVIQKKLEDWEQPVIEIDNERIEVPRRAGISSFGAGGSNAHVIMEEYIPKQKIASKEYTKELIFISADEEELLKELLKKWSSYLEKTDAKLHDIAYTSIAGRTSRAYRFAMVMDSKDDARAKIHEYMTRGKTGDNTFYGIVEKEKPDADAKRRFGEAAENRKLDEIAIMWTSGAELDYLQLFDKKYNHRVSLPKHPLRKNRHWIKVTYDSNNIAKDSGVTISHNVADVPKGKTEISQGKPANAEIPTISETVDAHEKVSGYLIEVLSDITGIKKEKINRKKDFSEFGIDSIGITNFGNKILKDFPSMSETALYAYQTVEDLANYISNTYEDEVVDFFDLGAQRVPLNEDNTAKQFKEDKETKEWKESPRDVAIIGISAKLPGSETTEEFWNNLCEYKATSEEITRWDLEEYYSPGVGMIGKTYCKNGNFLKDIDKFDAHFFHIARSEADTIDPQERIFLETVWNAMEDAGYTKDTLDRNTGVYAGVTTSSYRYIGYEESMKGNMSHSTTSFASIANRVSYVLNLNGPSMPVDTMCSSTLAAIHMACRSIHVGECKMAIAGGVNLYSHPMALVNLSQVKLLSQDDKTRSFCENGTGFLPSEAVGAVILKSLAEARKDGDYVYGIIKGSAAAHAGKTTAYFSSNPLKQARIIENAIKDAGVPKESISYIETMTVGSETGDSLEIEGLKHVFQAAPDGGNGVLIGSVKPNIGHAEAASGVGQLLKVLLQFKHKRLAPTLLNGKVSNKIRLEGSQLHIQTKEEDWQQIKYTKDCEIDYYPRRAGISSFGAGGYGVHMILEEAENGAADIEYNNNFKREAVIPISSNTKKGVLRNSKKLLEYCEGKDKEGILYDIAYNLQYNRQEYPYRIAIIADSMKGLRNTLKVILEGNFEGDNLYTNLVEKANKVSSWDSEQQRVSINWVQGDNVDWESLGGLKCRKIPLPGYSFEPVHCWIDKKAHTQENFTAIQQGNYTLMPFWNGIIYKYLNEKGMNLIDERTESCSTAMYPFLKSLLKLLIKNQVILPSGEGYLISEVVKNESFQSVVENPERRSEFLMRVFPELSGHLLLLSIISSRLEDILKENITAEDIFHEEEEKLYAVIKNENRFDNLLLNSAAGEIEEKLGDFIGIIKILDNNTFTANIGRLLIEICRKNKLTVEYYLAEDIPYIRKMKERVLSELGVDAINITREQAEAVTGFHVVVNGRKDRLCPTSGSDVVCISSFPAIKEYYIILYKLMKDPFDVETVLKTVSENLIEIVDSESISGAEKGVADYVLDIITKELGVSKSNIELEVELSDYGMNSILMARMYTQLVDEYGEKIEPKDILQSKCTKDIILNIENKLYGERKTVEKQETEILDVATEGRIFTGSSGNSYEYTVEGEGEPLIILTALAFIPEIWEHQKKMLGNKYKMFMPALPAHGNSAYKGQKLSFDIIAGDLKEFMEYLNIDSAYMIGWCMAGNILQKFMSRYPKFVKKACLVCTTPEDASIRGVNAQDLQNYSKDPLGTYELEFMNIYGGDESKAKHIQKYMKLIKNSHCQVDSVALLYYIDELFKFDIKKESESIDIPTLIIAGRWDITYPAEQVELLKQVFRNTRFEVFEHSGHMPFVSEGDKFNEQIYEFLN